MKELKFATFSVLVAFLMLLSGMVHAQPPTPKDGFTWTPWLAAGERVWGAVVRIEPKMKDVIGDGDHVAVAIADLNFDGQRDIVLYFWGADQCGVDGCTYVILSNNGRIKRSFIARTFKRQGDGLNIDGRYYTF